MGGVKGFVEGGIASVIAGCSTHPLDLIKVRMQLQGESSATAAPAAATTTTTTAPTAATTTTTAATTTTTNLRPSLAFQPSTNGTHTITLPQPPPPKMGPIGVGVKIIRQEGVSALYSGVSATVLRQGLYSTTRMGLYEILKTKWADPPGPNSTTPGNLPLGKKIVAGLISGGIGAACGNPADVAMVRMQADGRLPPSERRNYTSVVNAIKRMCKDEGILSLWRGSSLTVNRAMLVTASQLASYDQFKETIIGHGVMKDGLGTHVTASFAAGFVAAVVSNPVDVIKTRVMNMRVKSGETAPYSGAIDCAMKTVKLEGPMALYKGFIPTISRQGPFTVVLFVTLEQVRKLLKDF